MTRACSRCGEELSRDATFCPSCGTTVENRPPAPHRPTDVTGTVHALGTTTSDSGPLPIIVEAEVPHLPAGSHVLVVARGPSTGMTLELAESPTTVGRSAETSIFLDDITVSRRHAQFETSGAGWALRDLGSLNGTYVNRHAIDRTDLKSGDEIQIGKYRFRYLVGE